MPKPRSETAAVKKVVTAKDADIIADELADKVYGESKAPEVKPVEKVKPITISLPPSLIEALEDAAMANKRKGEGAKSVSAIVRKALEENGFS